MELGELIENRDEEYVHEPRFGGYDFVFVDQLSSGQTCSICLVAMRNPVQTTCGHRFCEDCLLGTFRQGNVRVCPQDRNHIPAVGGFFRDVAWERDILSLRVKCKKNEAGCDWIGQLRHYEEHCYLCLFEDVACENCEEEMQRRFLDEHMSSECRNRIVQCEYCEEEFAFWCTEVHEGEECTRFPLECPQQCGLQEIPREEVESHMRDDCSMTIVVCPYQGAGCTFNDKRMTLKSHIEESTEEHLSKTWSELMKAKEELDEVKEIKGHVEEIQGRVEELQSEKKAMETSLQKHSEELSDLKMLEKKLEVENLSLRKEITELVQQLSKMKEHTASENRSLKQLVQSLQTRVKAIEKPEAEAEVKEYSAATSMSSCMVERNKEKTGKPPMKKMEEKTEARKEVQEYSAATSMSSCMVERNKEQTWKAPASAESSKKGRKEVGYAKRANWRENAITSASKQAEWPVMSAAGATSLRGSSLAND